MLFPLRFRPAGWRGDLGFGADRKSKDGHTRQHAGCDLLAPVGTEVLAVDDGVVIEGPTPFTTNVFDLVVWHTTFVVRYGEISGAAPGVRVGVRVTRGQVIGLVGKMEKDSMLHFEMYSGFDKGPLTDRSRPPFERRADLMDPTDFLDRAELVSSLPYPAVVPRHIPLPP